MTDQPTPSAQPSPEQLDHAREERDAAARARADEKSEDREREAEEVWSQMDDARDRAEAMGDVVEDGTRESGTGSSTQE